MKSENNFHIGNIGNKARRKWLDSGKVYLFGGLCNSNMKAKTINACLDAISNKKHTTKLTLSVYALLGHVTFIIE